MNRRALIGALAALVAAPVAALRTKCVPLADRVLRYKSASVFWDSRVPANTVYFVRADAFQVEDVKIRVIQPRKLGVITSIT